MKFETVSSNKCLKLWNITVYYYWPVSLRERTLKKCCHSLPVLLSIYVYKFLLCNFIRIVKLRCRVKIYNEVLGRFLLKSFKIYIFWALSRHTCIVYFKKDVRYNRFTPVRKQRTHQTLKNVVFWYKWSKQPYVSNM